MRLRNTSDNIAGTPCSQGRLDVAQEHADSVGERSRRAHHALDLGGRDEWRRESPVTPYRLSLTASSDPYPTYRRMRDEDPAHYSETEDVWVLTRYSDVSDAFRDWRTWSSQRRGNLLNDIPERIGKTLGTTDPPDHRFARSLVEKAFTHRSVEALEPSVLAMAEEITAEARERGTIEFVQDISAPFNAGVLGAMFGVPKSDFLLLRHWLDDFFQREEAPAGNVPTQVVAMRALNDYLDGLADERAARPGTDLMSAMLQAEEAGRRLKREQVVVTTMTFLTAGFESTNNLFTNLAYALALHPDAYQLLSQATSMVQGAIEESMRWDAAAQGFVRCPTREVLMHDKTIPEGSQVLLHIGSANRDEREFENPDRFDLERETKRHLGMGQGIHFCVGAPLGRMMARTLFSTLLPVSRQWEIDLAGAHRVTTPNFRGFSVLPLTI